MQSRFFETRPRSFFSIQRRSEGVLRALKGGFLLVIALLLWMTPNAAAQTGPGGVGEGGQELLFYLDASRATPSAIAGGAALETWEDIAISPSPQNDATAANPSTAPRFRDAASSAAQNGFPVIDFAGTRRLTFPTGGILNDGSGARTFLVAFRTGPDITTRQVLFDHGDASDGVNLYLQNGELAGGHWTSGNFNNVSTSTLQAETFYVATYEYNASGNQLQLTLFESGVPPTTFTETPSIDAIPNTRTEAAALGAQNGESRFGDGASEVANDFGVRFGGDLAVVAFYDQGLNDAQIRIVGNTAADKYGLDTSVRPGFSAADEYPGDIAAIGQLNGDVHDPAASSILQIDAQDSFADGQFVIVGHDTGDPVFVSETFDANVDGGGTVTLVSILDRVWANDNDGPSNFSTQFQFDVSGLPGLQTDQEFYILRSAPGENNPQNRFNRNGTTNTDAFGPFTVSDISMDGTIADGISIDDDQFFTIGRTATGSPDPPMGLTYGQTTFRILEGNTITTAAPSADDGGQVQTFTISGAPANVTIDAQTGEITFNDGGTTPAGIYTGVTVTATNSGGSDTETLTLEIVREIVDLSYPSTSFATESGQGLGSISPTITYGPTNARPASDATTTFRLLSGTLPSGVTLGSDGTISGTPTESGIFPVTVEVEGTGTLTGAEQFSLTILVDANALVGTTGPGGIGGPENNLVWLRGDLGVIEDDGNGTFLWEDQSGNDRDFNQSSPGNQPAFATGVLNGNSVVRFDGDQDRLEDDSGAGYINGLEAFSIFAVVTSNDVGSDRGFFDTEDPDGNDDDLAIRFDNAGANSGRDNVVKVGINFDAQNSADLQIETSETIAGEAVQQTGPILTGVRWVSGSSIAFSLNGTDDPSPDLSPSGGASGSLDGASKAILGVGPKDQGANTGWNGDIAEFIIYNSDLNVTRRTIIQNYLASKYAITLTGKDVYAGDLGEDGVQGGGDDYDIGVFGVGREADDDLQFSAETDGLRFDIATGFDNGDYLVAGHRTPVNSVNTSDVNGVVGLESRSERTWYVSRTEPSSSDLTADVTLSLSEAGLAGPAGLPSDYVLLARTPGTTDWTSIASADAVVENDEIVFRGVSVSDGQEITLGTTDEGTSPLDSGALVISGTPGADGADQGWRYLSIPGQGATAGDLQRLNGSQFIDFSLQWMAYTNSGDGVDPNNASGTQGDGWTPVEKPGTSLDAGEGFILWFFDNAQYPVNPTLSVQLNPSISQVGASDVTVNVPANSNGTANTVHLIGNPYRTPYNLNSLGNPNGDDFDDVVQIWEANATLGENDPAERNDQNVGTFVMRSRSGGDAIAPWQGFLLGRTTAGSGSDQIAFNSTGRGASRPAGGLVGSKSAAQTQVRQARLALTLTGKNASGSVVTVDKAASVVFRDGATEGRDRYDAPKLTPMSSTFAALAPISSRADGSVVYRAQESRPYPTAPVEIPLALEQSGSVATLEVHASDLDLPQEWEAWIVDTKGTPETADDVLHPLVLGGAPYPFTPSTQATSRRSSASTAAAMGRTTPGRTTPPRPPILRPLTPTQSKSATGNAEASTSRLRLRVEPSGTLPVELTTLRAQPDGERILVQWTTASETNNAGFSIEHQRAVGPDSTLRDGGWSRLGFVGGAGTTDAPTDYQYRASGLDYGTHAFRLRQVDLDGQETVSRTVWLRRTLDGAYQISRPYPNPARMQSRLEVTVQRSQTVTVSVYDVMGRRVTQLLSEPLAPNRTRRLDVPAERLASGAYFIRIVGEDFQEVRRLTVVR